MIETYRLLAKLAKTTYEDIISETKIIQKRSVASGKLRIIFKDSSFLDIWLSVSGKYSYHWEQRAQRGRILRYDNAPFHPEVPTHPKHLHDGSEQNVKGSDISADPKAALKSILDIVRKTLHK